MKKLVGLVLTLSVFLAVSCANPYLGDAAMIEGDGVTLESELVMPEGGRALKPAVVFAVGSGTDGFREYTPGFRENLVEGIFLPRDIAVLYINKRGTGESSGNWKWGSIEQQAEDVVLAVEYLRTVPGIDPEKIGVVGHSQGGWVVQLAGSLDEEIAFVLSYSGPTVSVREQDVDRVTNDMICEGYSADEIAREIEKLDQKHERVIRNGGWFPFFQARLGRNLFMYDPREAITGLAQPTLLAFGGLDNMVPPAHNLERLAEIFPAGVPANITTHVADSTDHMFRITDSICFDYYEAIGDPYSTDFIDYVGSWVDSLGL